MSETKVEHRSVIKFLTKEGNGPKAIHERMVAVYGEDAPSYFQVKYWSKLFRWGRESINDDPKSGRPVEARTEDIVGKVENLVLKDRRVKISVIANEVCISEASVLKILHDDLGMKKVSARWIPRLLTPEQKLYRKEVSRENLAELEWDKIFLSRIITGDETWVHHWNPPTKQESMQWVHKGSPPPKKAKTQFSGKKLMATVFWDAKGVLLIEYMPRGSTINGEAYGNTIKNLKTALEEKRPHSYPQKNLLLHDNCRVHKANKVQQIINDCGFIELRHPPYSPDLAPSDFFLFKNLKKHLRGKRFASDEELEEAVEEYFAGLPKQFFSEGMGQLEKRWNKCISVEGSYVEK